MKEKKPSAADAVQAWGVALIRRLDGIEQGLERRLDSIEARLPKPAEPPPTVKLCRDCVWFRPKKFPEHSPRCGRTVEPVAGEPEHACSTERSASGHCGVDGRNWKQKPNRPVPTFLVTIESPRPWWKFWA